MNDSISKNDMRTFRASANLAVLLFTALAFAWASHFMVNGDIWWHLRTGSEIAERGIPQQDIYTFASNDARWIDLHWLFQLLVANVYEWSGATGLVLLKALISSLTVFVLLIPFRERIPNWLFVWAAWPFLSLFASRLLVRPEMLSFLYLSATLSVIHYSYKSIRILYLLPVVQLLWVNSQGLFVLQYVVMFAYAAQVFLSKSARKRSCFAFPNSYRHFVIAGVTTGLATLCNPYGLEGALFPLELMEKMGGEHKAFYLQFAGEIRGLGDMFASNSFDAVLSNPSVLHLLFVVLITGLSLGISTESGGNRIYHTLLFLGFGYLGWTMSRNDPLVGLAYGYITFSRLSDSKSFLDAAQNPITDMKLRYLNAASITVAVFLLYIAFTGKYHHDEQSPFEKAPWFGESVIYPHSAADFISNIDSVQHIYADHELLSALCIFHMRDDQRVFADARLEVNSKSSLAAYREIRRKLNRDIDAALIQLSSFTEKNPALVFLNNSFFDPKLPNLLSNLANDPNWRCVYSDPFLEDNGPTRFILGATVFLPVELAEGSSLAPVDVSHLLNRLQ